MNIQVTSEKVGDGKIQAKVVVAAADVDAAIKKTYSDIATNYRFQGFRKGRVPRPVIDGMIGRKNVLGETTNQLMQQVEPLLFDELDVVPISEPNYGEGELPTVAEGEDYVLDATITVRPDVTLSTYEAPTINMPPAEPTEAEIDEQIDVLQGYHTTYDEIEEDRAVEAADVVSINVENVENAERFAGENRMLDMAGTGMPSAFDEQLVGLTKGETRDLEWTDGEGDAAVTHKVKVTLNSIRKANTPELTDEFVKKSYGFDTIAELREAVSEELAQDKAYTLPNVKENRLVDAVAATLELEEIPEEYVNNVYTDLVQNFLTQLQNQGTTLDSYLQVRGITAEAFLDDLRQQAQERARQSLALDALADHLELKVEHEDLVKEFTDANMDAESSIEEFRNDGRLPAVREAIRRSKALEWLVANCKINEVDEIAERRAARAAEAPAEEPAAEPEAASEEPANEE